MKRVWIDSGPENVIEGKRRATLTIDILLPAITGLQVTGVDHQDKHITLSLASTHPTAHCPVCGHSSEKIHSRYQRRVFDLPWSDKQVHLLLTVRRFFCSVEDCQRKVFAERLHPAIKAWARRTSRLDHHLEALALKAGGEGGALLCHLLNICRVSADTLLNLSRKTPIVSYESIPRIVGIDEWAIRKGQTYATIVVDLETRRPIELLANAEVKTVETWFKEHPDINIVSRDRDTMFAEAARRGASQARQVADRWHLLKNLGDAVKRMLEAHSAGLKETATAMLDEPVLQQKDSVRTASPVGGTHASEPEPVTKSARQHKKVKELAAKGWSIRKIASHLRMNRQTVKKYTLIEKVPKKQYSKDFGPNRSLSNEQVLFLARRWAESEANPKQLWQELKQQGYSGSPASVYRAVAHFPPRDTSSVQQAIREALPPLSVRQALWLLIKQKDQLAEKKQKVLELLLEHHSQAKEAYPLIQQFTAMVRDRQAEKLNQWIADAKNSSIAQLKQFARGLERDYEAVKAGLSLQWSNGQVEGQINRLKLIKRQAYGRAKLDLLKKRVFYKPARQAA